MTTDAHVVGDIDASQGQMTVGGTLHHPPGATLNGNVTYGTLTNEAVSVDAPCACAAAACGSYYLDAISMNGQAVGIHATGRAALFIGGNIEADSLGLTLDPGAELDVFVAGTVQVSGSFTIGSPNYPALSRTYIAGSELLLEGNTNIGGYVYAPAAPLVINSPLNMCGGLFVASFANAQSETYIHFDAAIAGIGELCDPPK